MVVLDIDRDTCNTDPDAGKRARTRFSLNRPETVGAQWSGAGMDSKVNEQRDQEQALEQTSLASLLSGIIVEDDSNPQVIRGELEARQIGGTKHLTGQR